MLNTAFATNKTQNLSVRSQFEPLPNLRVEFNALRNYSRSFTEYFKFDTLSNSFDSFSPMTTGAFSISFMSLSTLFEPTDNRFYTSENFENFKEYRMTIANRFADNNPDWDGTRDSITNFPSGYGPTSQDVLISSFMAAYAGWDPQGSTLNPFLKIPIPGWRLTYDGLTRIPALQRLFQNVTISHGYRSTFNIGSFRSDIRYRDPNDGYQSVIDMASGNFVPEYEIAQVSINEQFNPLINIDVTWQNSLLTRFEFSKSRDIALSFANNQITDVSSQQIIIGSGYRFRDLAFNLTQPGGSRQRIQSDLILRLDLAFRQNRTVLRKLVEDVDQISAGQESVSINASAEYQVSPRVNLRFFYDQVINNPFVSNQFPNTNTHAGFSMRFMLM
ncbi:MAG: cell surface protein SprA, partial [Bacteroidales bacterium]